MTRLAHTTTIRVRYADTDKMGIVYNGNYLRYFEIGRTELLRALGLPYATLEELGYLLPVMEAAVQYRVPARYDDLLDIQAVIDVDDQSAQLAIVYTIRRGDDIIATGSTRHGFVLATTWRIVRPPAVFRDAVLRARSIMELTT